MIALVALIKEDFTKRFNNLDQVQNEKIIIITMKVKRVNETIKS